MFQLHKAVSWPKFNFAFIYFLIFDNFACFDINDITPTFGLRNVYEYTLVASEKLYQLSHIKKM